MAKDISIEMNLPLEDGTGEVVDEVNKEKEELDKEANKGIKAAIDTVEEINDPKGVETPEPVKLKVLTEQLILKEELDEDDYFELVHELYQALEKVCKKWIKFMALDEEDINRAVDEAAVKLIDGAPWLFESNESSNESSEKLEENLEEDFKVIRPLSSYEPWSGAIQTWSLIKDADKLDELDSLLEEVYPEGLDETELNDLLWFEPEWILESLGISDEDMYSNED